MSLHLRSDQEENKPGTFSVVDDESGQVSHEMVYRSLFIQAHGACRNRSSIVQRLGTGVGAGMGQYHAGPRYCSAD